MSTDKLHEAMGDAIQHLSGSHPVRAIWESLDEALKDGGPDRLPGPWA